MSEKSIKKNYIYNMLYQILTIITPLITTPYISRVLGADGIGRYSFATACMSYFVMAATMGSTSYGEREVAYCREDKRELSKVFWNTVIFRFVNVLICTFIYIAFVFWGNKQISLYLILLINLFTIVVDIAWLFQGLEEFKAIVLRDSFFKCLSVVLIFLFVKEKDDLLLYVLISVGLGFLSSIYLWFLASKYIDFVPVKELKPWKDTRIMLELFIPTIAVQIYTVLDKTMLGVITDGEFENGYYEQAMKISKLTLAIITAMGKVVAPRIGYYYAHKKTDLIKQNMYTSYRFVWFLGVPLCFGLFAVSNHFVPWFFGSEFEKVSDVLKILCFLILAIGINNVTGVQYLIPVKKQNILTKTLILGASMNFILNMILIPRLQSIGAAIASVVAETVIVIAQFIFVRKELDWKTIIKIGHKYFIAGGVMLVLLLIIRNYLSVTISGTICLVLTGTIIYFVCLLIMKDDFLISNIRSLLDKFNFKHN